MLPYFVVKNDTVLAWALRWSGQDKPKYKYNANNCFTGTIWAEDKKEETGMETSKAKTQAETFGWAEAMRRLLAGKKVRLVDWDKDQYIYLKEGDIRCGVGRSANFTIDFDTECFEEYVEPREEFDFYEMVKRVMDGPSKKFESDDKRIVVSIGDHLEDKGVGLMYLTNGTVNAKWHEVTE